MLERDKLNKTTEEIIAGAVEVHRALGPGLLESAYEACLSYELARRGLRIQQQKPLPVIYGDVEIECGYRLDLLVEESVVVELKAIELLAPIHKTQLLTYLRLAN